MKTRLFVRTSWTHLVVAIGLLLAVPRLANATLLTDLQSLGSQASSLKTTLAAIQVTGDEACAAVADANQQARDLVAGLDAVNASLAAPLQVDADVLTAIDQLTVTGLGLANEALRLSTDLKTFAAAADSLTIRNGLNAMLQLSGEIGAMADRIGAMSDKILVMADNIGLMADRILETQQLQSDNLTLTVQSVLRTQTNALSLVQVVEDASYDLTIASVIENGNLLAAKMSAVVLSPWTMATKMAAVAADVKAFADQVRAFSQTVTADTSLSTTTVNATTMNSWVSMSAMLSGLTTAVTGYSVAISGLQALTSTPTLGDTLGSMLQLSGDIGVMANRILEMGDQILAMADNIGMQADLIVSTQGAMNVNVATVQGSLLATQLWAIDLIKARGL